MPPKFRSEYGRHRESERQSLLDGASDDEDFFLKGPTAKPGRLVNSGDAKMIQMESEINDVVDIMRNNIDKTMDRGDRLEDLQDKSDVLSSNADVFNSRSKSLRNRMWWRECRMRILLALVVVILLAIIIIPIVVKHH